jgi:large subunit ribosomal protein L18
MAKNARYRVPFRRRREGKTNYHLRRRLVRSRKIRVVVRLSNNHSLIQFIEAGISGDKTLSASHSRELKDYKWSGGTSNLPSTYLTGYLAGMKAQKAKINSAIFDIGLKAPVYGSRVFAALKGIVDAGIDIPHSEKVFPAEDRITGQHIVNYAQLLKKEDPEKFKKQYSKYQKAKIDPEKIPKFFDQTKNAIQQRG